MLDRAAALALVHEYTGSDALRKHMYAVEIVMRAMAGKFGADPEYWGIIGLVHDFDYERFPNPSRSATEEHPAEGVRILAGHGLPDDGQQAILGHATYSGIARSTPLAKALFAVDELSGFLVACALVRPSRSLADLEVSSVKKNSRTRGSPGVSAGRTSTGASRNSGCRSRTTSGSCSPRSGLTKNRWDSASRESTRPPTPSGGRRGRTSLRSRHWRPSNSGQSGRLAL